MGDVKEILCGLSLLPADDLRIASAPLFEEGVVDAVEWSVDFGFAEGGPPAWADALLRSYEARGRLFAHGVELSPMSAKLLPHQRAWLESLEAACAVRRFQHVTEHYGFMTAGDVVRGTPLPLPPSRAALEIACERVALLERTTGVPVGIENLAFAFSADDALAQAEFLRALVSATGAFVLLDVHNLLCQAENFGLDAAALAERLPLDRVREVHVAGGSVVVPRSEPARMFRRDSHDEDVPPAALALLEALLPRCPHLELIVLERSDRSTFSAAEAARYRADFHAIRRIAARRTEAAAARRDPPARLLETSLTPATDDASELDACQRALLTELGSASDPEGARRALDASAALAPYAAWIRTFEPRALEIGAAMVREWAGRAPGPDEMYAAVFRAPGLPLGLSPLPVPRPGPGQVLLRVAAVGLCGTDVHATEGRFPVPTPIVLGHETVGVVEEVGEGVEEPRPGDRVGLSWVQAGCGACTACRRSEEQRCAAPLTWIENGGGLSELVVAQALGCTRLPDALPFEEAAPLFCAGHVAYSGLLRARPRPGERVAVLGLGGLGHLAVQIARALGHEVFAVTSQEDKLADARTLGAHEALLARGDPGEALQAAGGADIILVTTSCVADAAAAAGGLRVGGRLVLLGLGDGTLELDPADLIFREASIIGAVQGPRAELEALLALAAGGAVRARVEVFPLQLANRALERLARGRVRYRAVVAMSGG